MRCFISPCDISVFLVMHGQGECRPCPCPCPDFRPPVPPRPCYPACPFVPFCSPYEATKQEVAADVWDTPHVIKGSGCNR